MDLSTNLPAEIAHTIHHTILDQISETIADTQAKIPRTDKVSPGTPIEAEGTSRTCGMTREIMGSKTGMTTNKIEIGLTTGDDQLNTNTAEINPEHR